LREWTNRVGRLYGGVEFDVSPAGSPVQSLGRGRPAETRFRVPGDISKSSFRRAAANECEFYFVASVGTLIAPSVLRDLVGLNLPIVAPFLRSISPDDPYSNYHADIDDN